MKNLAKLEVFTIFLVLIPSSFEQYWDNFNQYGWDPSYFGLNQNIGASQSLNNPIFTAIKQTISSTNEENDGLGTFIGTYKENKTNTISEVSKPEDSKPIDLKPGASTPEPIDTKPQDLPISKPNGSTEANIKPTSESSINKPSGKPVTNQNQNSDKEFAPSPIGLFYQNAPLFFPPHHVPQFHPVIFNHPLFPLPIQLPTQYQSFGQAPIPIPAQLPVESRPSFNGPFAIQQPTITQNGDTIVENLIGGLEFNCQGRATGHYRDIKFCDVFHACVFGRRKKTYACPFVGEAQYFDDLTRRCEFIRNNPLACELKESYN